MGSLWDVCALTIGFQKLPECNQQLVSSTLNIKSSIRYSTGQEVTDLPMAGKFIKKCDPELHGILV
jgi:hypothetical protein